MLISLQIYVVEVLVVTLDAFEHDGGHGSLGHQKVPHRYLCLAEDPSRLR